MLQNLFAFVFVLWCLGAVLAGWEWETPEDGHILALGSLWDLCPGMREAWMWTGNSRHARGRAKAVTMGTSVNPSPLLATQHSGWRLPFKKTNVSWEG